VILNPCAAYHKCARIVVTEIGLCSALDVDRQVATSGLRWILDNTTNNQCLHLQQFVKATSFSSLRNSFEDRQKSMSTCSPARVAKVRDVLYYWLDWVLGDAQSDC
jgi:hypothetical protein